MSHFQISWVEPFKHPFFGKFCWANFLNATGIALLSMTFIFDLTTFSMLEVLGFFVCQFIVLGLIFMPLSFYLHEKVASRKWRGFILLTSVIPVFLLPLFSGHIVIQGMLYGLCLSPFWVVFHIFMTKNTSLDNKGNEVSVALNTLAVGSMIGAAIATALKVVNVPLDMIFFAGSLLSFISVYLLCRFEEQAEARQKQNNVSESESESESEIADRKTVWQALTESPSRSVNTLLTGFFNVHTFQLWGLWLLKSGLTFAAVGIVEVLSTLLRLIISGHSGKFTNMGNGRDLRTSGVLSSLGWFPWLFSASPVIIPFTVLIWNIARQFHQVGMTSQWYSCQSIACLTAHEILLSIGRIIGLCVCVPLLFIAPVTYVVVGFSTCVCIYFYNSRKSIRNGKEPIHLQEEVESTL